MVAIPQGYRSATLQEINEEARRMGIASQFQIGPFAGEPGLFYISRNGLDDFSAARVKELVVKYWHEWKDRSRLKVKVGRKQFNRRADRIDKIGGQYSKRYDFSQEFSAFVKLDDQQPVSRSRNIDPKGQQIRNAATEASRMRMTKPVPWSERDNARLAAEAAAQPKPSPQTHFPVFPITKRGQIIGAHPVVTDTTKQGAQEIARRLTETTGKQHMAFEWQGNRLVAVGGVQTPFNVATVAKPKPGRFQAENRLGWNKQQYDSFLANAKPGSTFRDTIARIAAGDMYTILNMKKDSFLFDKFKDQWTTQHPYPGIVALLNRLQKSWVNPSQGVAFSVGDVKPIAKEIEKRLVRLYDFARLQRIKSQIMTKALKSYRGT